ncbi:hypothetical protein CL684_03095 [Candidatus Campbellbacteria bacterium]|nr:hypothetical protein [Candidatus Campbellbacteria bacterium]|tara:strand:- start:610 stop:1608 length:999 start_codon:yes stop_codon:yes gene_type:complete
MTIKERMEKFKEGFNIHFENEVRSVLREQRDFHEITTELDEPLKDYILSYTKGGKRIRPFLIHFFGDNDNKDLITLALAVELFHLAALIHDDMMDGSYMRRGEKTIHIAVQAYSKENTHLGTDIGLLLGDVFLTASLAKAAQLPNHLFEEFRSMIQRTIRGQYLDSFGMNQILGDQSYEEVIARHKLKTAWYTFCSPARLGYMSNKQYDLKTLEQITVIMCELGLLYQIRDDIIDCIDENSGKALFGDITENQTTWVTLYIKEKYPVKFKEILQAKESNNTALLKAIFKDIDLKTPYKQEYQQRHEMIESMGEEFIELKENMHKVLELLMLK